jgi:hypothetical protein
LGEKQKENQHKSNNSTSKSKKEKSKKPKTEKSKLKRTGLVQRNLYIFGGAFIAAAFTYFFISNQALSQ